MRPRFLAQVLGLSAVLAGLVWLMAVPAEAGKKGASAQKVDPVKKAQATNLLRDGLVALAAQNVSGAEGLLQNAYTTLPTLEGLHALGLLAMAQGQTLVAQDLMNRYLADPLLESASDGGPASDAEETRRQQEARRIVALPRGLVAMVEVQGARGTLLKVDGRPTGVLPLSAALMLAPGPHQIEIILADKQIREKVRLQGGRLSELRYNLSTRAILLNVLPVALWVLDAEGLADDERKSIARRLEDAIVRERYSPQRYQPVAKPDRPEVTANTAADGSAKSDQTATLAEGTTAAPAAKAAADPEPTKSIAAAPPATPPSAAAEDKQSAPTPQELSCSSAEDCALQQARRLDAEYVVTARYAKTGNQVALSMTLVDVVVGLAAASAEKSCPGCTVEQGAATLADWVAPLLAAAAEKKRGTLRVTSTPPGAEISVDGRTVGKTPYEAAAFVGVHRLQLRIEGYEDESAQAEIKDGEKAELNLSLRERPVVEPPPEPLKPPPPPPAPPPPPPAPPPPRPPIARWIIGAGAVVGGAALIGFGIPALTLNGQCADDPVRPDAACVDLFRTTPLGASLTAVGAASLVTGVVLLAWPPRPFAKAKKR